MARKSLAYIRKMKMNIRVTVTTGMDDPDRLAALTALSPDLILKKPIDLNALLRGLETAKLMPSRELVHQDLV